MGNVVKLSIVRLSLSKPVLFFVQPAFDKLRLTAFLICLS